MDIDQLLARIVNDRDETALQDLAQDPTVKGYITKTASYYDYDPGEVEQALLSLTWYKFNPSSTSDLAQQWFGFLRRGIPHEITKRRRVERPEQEMLIIDDDNHDFPAPDPYEELEANLDFETLISGLDPTHQEIIRLLYRDRLTEREAAQQLGISQTKLHRLKQEAFKNICEKLS